MEDKLSGLRENAMLLDQPRKVFSSKGYFMHIDFQKVSFAITVAFLGLGVTARAEEIELTHCYSGTGAPFFQSKDAPALTSWNQNGIIMSSHPKKLLHNAVVHCEGIQIGTRETGSGQGYCKIIDEDGDAIIAETPYSGVDYDMKLLHGTGKWKGVTGSLHSTRIARSENGKGAMPGTYQGCRSERGQFDLPK